MDKIIKKIDKWFPIITRRGAVLLGWIESIGYGEKLLKFTDLNLTDYKEIRIVKDKEHTIFLEGISWSKTEGEFREKLKTDKNYLNCIFKKFYPRLSELEKFSALKNLSKVPDTRLGDLIIAYADLYSDISPFYIVYNEVRPILREKTENWLKKRVPKSKLQDYHIALSTPLKPPYLTEENNALQKIIETIKIDKKAKELLEKSLSMVLKKLPEISPKIFRMIKRHLRSYYWVPVERDNPRWQMEDIVSRIQYRLKQQRVFEKKKGLPEKQMLYEKELKIPPKMMVNFQGLRDLMAAVDAMKKAYAISHCFLSDFLDETAKRLKVKRDILYFLTPKEILKLLKTKEQISKTEVRSRKNCIVIGHRVKGKWRVEIIKGRQAKLIISKLSLPQKVKEEEIIKGTPASPGKARGLVKVLKDASEVDKLSQGEILVTPMTTPDFIMAIHKAAAIVTDEGGVLCHAAIISREFGIPCIIGTRIATKVLKDGDYVEVDAGEGMVKRLNERN